LHKAFWPLKVSPPVCASAIKETRRAKHTMERFFEDDL
jgi:hypothetical protein